MPRRNTAITMAYRAEDASGPVINDQANHTLRLLRDGAVVVPSNSPTQPDATNMPGWYVLSITAAENDGAVLALGGKSSTAGVVLSGAQWTNESNVAQVNANATAASNLASNIANLDAAVSSRLAPTTAGRTLDVSAGGEAGIDWGNIGNQTSAAALTNTLVSTVLGNVNGAVTGSVGSVAGDVGGRVLGAGASVFQGVGVQADLIDGAIDAGAWATSGRDLLQNDVWLAPTTITGPNTYAERIDARVSSRLAPSVAGRSLSVSASGAADANVELWRGEAPDALVSGQVKANVYRWVNAPVQQLVAGFVQACRPNTFLFTVHGASNTGVSLVEDCSPTGLGLADHSLDGAFVIVYTGNMRGMGFRVLAHSGGDGFLVSGPDPGDAAFSVDDRFLQVGNLQPGDQILVLPSLEQFAQEERFRYTNDLAALINSLTQIMALFNAKLGPFTTSGENNILGFLRALARNDAPLPTDLGGTYAPASHSAQAIRARGDAAWTGGGGGGSSTVEMRARSMDPKTRSG